MPGNRRRRDDDAVDALHRALPTAGPVAVAALGLAANVAAASLYADAAPYLGFLDLVRTALPGVALAAAAVAVAVLGRGGAGPMVLAAGSLVAAAPSLSVGLAQRSTAWVLVGAVGYLAVPAVVLAALLFPSGRLFGKVRQAVGALVVLLGVAICLVQAVAYNPGGWGWCRCLGNPLASLGIGSAGYPELADRLVLVDMAAVAAGLAGFWAARPRRLRGLPAAFAAAFTVLAISWLAADVSLLGSAGAAPAAVRGTRDATLVLLPALYAAGFATHRPSRSHVADLLLAVRDDVRPRHLQSLVARAIGDPGAVVAWWDPARAGFRDHADRLVDVPTHGVLRVEAEGRPIAVVLAERIDLVDSGVRDSVAQALLLAAENRRLTAELRASLEQVRDSRARIVAAGDDTRRRIERDLHDGAQQLLISTGIKLNLAAARAGESDAALSDALDDAAVELNRALVELRNLASGIAPASLVHGDLESALLELALHSAVPTTVSVTGTVGPDEGAAATAYFVVAECLTNIVKHAGATNSSVTVELDDPLHVTVADDGRGGASLDGAGAGTGLRGLVDRVEARGGWLELVSGPDGTTVTATVPARQPSGDPDVVTQ
jgi:signal transduction histidine kinase